MKRNFRESGGFCDKLILTFILLILAALLIAGFYKMHGMSIDMDHLQKDMEYLSSQQQMSGRSISQTEYLKTIDFLETETAKYRAFVEKQQEFMVWLVGLIGAVFSGITVYLGIKSRKDIAATVKEEYSHQIEQAVAAFVGGQDKVRYLESCIKKEEQIS